MTAAFVACLVFSACRDDRTPYRIGIVLDDDGVRGAALAVEQVNAQGGINGHPLELHSVGGTSTTKAQVALQTAIGLAEDPTILAVVGHTSSAASLAASQIYNARGVTQIAPTSSTPIYSRAGPYSFRLVGSDVHQGVFLSNRLLSLTPRPRIAVMYTNDDYGRPLRGVLVERLREGGVVPVYDAPFKIEDKRADMSGMLVAMARVRPELLLWIGRANEFAQLRSELKRLLPGLTILASDGFDGDIVSRDTGALVGVTYVRFVDPNRRDSLLVRFRERHRSGDLRGTSDQAILSYDAVNLLAEAIRHGGPKRDAIRDWIWEVGKSRPAVTGLSGPIAFPSGGDRAPLYFVETITKTAH